VKERVFAVLLGSALAGLMSGCNVHQVKANARNAIDAILGRVPQSHIKKASAPNATVSGAPQVNPAEEEAKKKLYESTQLLHEMFQVVLLREPYGPEEFGMYVNTLSQGGSLEGIYNGIVNSDYYHKLEGTPAPAYPATVKVFAQLISPMQRELAKTKFHPSDLGANPPFDVAQYEKLYAKASFFELKRYLGNEAMKVVEAKLGKGDSREELAKWYADWVVQMSTQMVDFGIPLRNRADQAFHHDWVMALKADVVSDRVIWEVLNRVHRTLNEAEAKASKRK
jgi:hypothetical protein